MVRKTYRQRSGSELSSHLRFQLEHGFFVHSSKQEQLDAALERAWGEHGEALTLEYVKSHPGCRPWAWWRFTAKCDRPGLPASWLFERGLLGADEQAAIRKDVRERRLSRWETQAYFPWLRSSAKTAAPPTG